MRRQLSGNHLLNHLAQKWDVRNGAEVYPESVDIQTGFLQDRDDRNGVVSGE